VNVTYTQGDPYTWATATFPWSSPSAANPWSSLAPTMINLTIAEDIVAVSEKPLNKSFTKKPLEAIFISEKLPFTVDKKLFDVFIVAEAYTDVISFMIKVMEAVSFDRRSPLSVSSLKHETVSFAEKSVKDISQLAAESLSLSEQLSKDHSLVLKDSLLFSEWLLKGVSLPKAEAFSLADKALKHAQTVSRENVLVTEKGSNQIAKSLFEAFYVLSRSSRSFDWTGLEDFSVLDGKPGFHMKKLSKETITMDDAYLDLISFIIKAVENISVTERLFKYAAKPFAGSVNIAEIAIKDAGKNVFEQVDIVDLINRVIAFNRKIGESLTLAEKLSKAEMVLAKDGFTLADVHQYKSVVKQVFQALSITDALAKSVVLPKKEQLALAETLVKTYKLSSYEAFSLVDGYIRSANAVLSGLYFEDGDLSLDDFLALQSTPIDYEPFKPFIPGDYEYQKALVRLLVEAGITAGRPQIQEWRLNIDVPDINDRGQADVAGVTRIAFNRSFNAPPEVTVSLKGGTVIAVPDVVKVYIDGFDVVLKDNAGNYVAGFISWSATGY